MTTDSSSSSRCASPAARSASWPVNGTVNDLADGGRAAAGAHARARARGGALGRGRCAPRSRRSPERRAAAGVEVVAGDTKVVERGKCDGMYVCTTGIGVRDPRARAARRRRCAPGDRLLVSGPIGEHGTAIMLARGEFDLDADIESDTCSLWPAVDALLDAAGEHLHCLRDATRGGVASVLNELARASQVAMIVREADVPVRPAVVGAAEILGIDPMYVANEGRMVVAVAAEGAEAALAALRAVPGCEEAAEIGEVRARAARHGAGRDGLRRPAGDGPARRRPAAEDLLMPKRRADARARPRRGGGRGRGQPRAGAARPRGGAAGRATCARWCRRRSTFAFELVTQGTRLEGAELELRARAGRGPVPARAATETELDRVPAAVRGVRRARTWSCCAARSCSSTRWSSTRRRRER